MKVDWSRFRNYRFYVALPWFLFVLLFIAIPVFLLLVIAEVLIFAGQTIKKVDKIPHFGAFGLSRINKWVRSRNAN